MLTLIINILCKILQLWGRGNCYWEKIKGWREKGEYFIKTGVKCLKIASFLDKNFGGGGYLFVPGEQEIDLKNVGGRDGE